MNRIFTLIFSLLAITSYSQYCMTGGPSTTADSNIESLTLVGASGSINYTGCPGQTGVVQYLAQTAYLNAGANYTVTIQFGTCGGNYPGVGQAWIDFNQNGIFEASESIGTWTGTPPTAISNFNFTVPGGAITGQSRMRVIQAENLSIPIDPCAAFTWGSTTDFSVYIQNGVDCSGYIGDDETDPRIVTSLPYNETHSSSICYSSQNPVYASPDVYYLVIPGPTVAALNISLCGSSFDTFLSVMDTDGNIIAINDDSPLCGVQSELQVSTIGHDSLYIIVEGWGVQSGNYVININQETLGNVQLENAANSIYPNPANDVLYIKGSFDQIVSIVDFNGRVVLENQITNNQLDISNMPAGAYFVHLTLNGQKTVHKLVVE